jgi:hypothetical protein
LKRRKIGQKYLKSSSNIDGSYLSLQMASGPSAQTLLNGNEISFKNKAEREREREGEYQHDFIKRPVLFCKLNSCLKIS